MTDISNPIFHDETKAREYLESVRWPDGPFCPHCGEAENVRKLAGKSHRPGLHACNSCRGHFTVTVGTVYERSKVPLHKWLMATHLLCASKKGMSAHQLHRMLGVTYKTAWFMAHRIREAMRDDSPPALGGPGTSVESDETFLGTSEKARKRRNASPDKRLKSGVIDKMKVVSLVERDGPLRSFHVDHVNSSTIQGVLYRNVDRKSDLLTDEAKYYKAAGKQFASHEAVNHSAAEYARGHGIHVNTLEGYFSIFKRGMKGVYQHCAEKHLKRYLCEFDFRYNTRDIEDSDRAMKALKGIEGKRLTYRRTAVGANV